MSESLISQLVTDFQTEYGVREETARHMVDIFLVVAVTQGKEQAEAEFTRIATESLTQGEAWAKDYFDGFFRTKFAQAPAIHAAAITAGTDPVAALQAVYGLQSQAAAELAAMIDAQAK